MKSYSAYFVRSNCREKAQKVFDSVEPVPGSLWLLCAFRKDASSPDDDVLWGRASLTEARSRELGEVLFVFGDTSIDGFVYEHARGGTLVRKLVWFPMLDDGFTAGWLCVQGEPESWESALFRADKLERYLELERERYEDEGKGSEFGQREAAIRTAWQSGRVEAGSTYPSSDGTVALLVERSFGIDRGRG